MTWVTPHPESYPDASLRSSLLSTLYICTVWFAGSETSHSSPIDDVGSSWTHSSVTSGPSTTQVRLCCLTTHPSLYLTSLHRLSPEKCVFRILKIPWEIPFFSPLVLPQDKVLLLQINSHQLHKYLTVRQTAFYPRDGITIKHFIFTSTVLKKIQKCSVLV